ncbi:hypothetical protein JTE90_023758, partial [Oedothorax gibbosus]
INQTLLHVLRHATKVCGSSRSMKYLDVKIIG